MSDTWGISMIAIVKEVCAKHDAELARYCPDGSEPDEDKFDIAFAAYKAECWVRIAEITPGNDIMQMVAGAYIETFGG